MTIKELGPWGAFVPSSHLYCTALKQAGRTEALSQLWEVVLQGAEVPLRASLWNGTEAETGLKKKKKIVSQDTPHLSSSLRTGQPPSGALGPGGK